MTHTIIAIAAILDTIATITTIDGTSLAAIERSSAVLDDIRSRALALLPSYEEWICDVKAERSTFEYTLLRRILDWVSEKEAFLSEAYEYEVYQQEVEEARQQAKLDAELYDYWEDKYGHLSL